MVRKRRHVLYKSINALYKRRFKWSQLRKVEKQKIRNMKGFIVEARAINIIVLSSILNNWLKLLIPL